MARDLDLQHNHADTGSTLMIIAWILFSVSLTVVCLRLYTRIYRVHRVSVDDYLIISAVVSELLHCIGMTVSFSYGLGRHTASLSNHRLEGTLKWVAMFEVFAVLTPALGRISFCAFLIFLVGPTKIFQKLILWVSLWIQVIINVIVIIQSKARCGTRIDALWKTSAMETVKCENPNVETYLGYVQSALNSACDVVLTVLPGIILWNLHMPKSTKFGLAAVLMLSVFAFAASIVKLVAIANLDDRGDFTWNMVNLQDWVCVENNMVIIAASIPTLRPLLLQRKNGSRAQKSNYGLSNPKSTGAIKLASGPETDSKNQSIAVHAEGAEVLDGTSEEYILQDVDDGIKRTTELQISYSEDDPPRSSPRGKSVF